MSILLPGFTLSRTIPADVVLGLLTGSYSLHGGVIRWAAGTANAGQIVRHLLPVSQPVFGMLPFSVIPGLDQVAQAFQLANLQDMARQNLALTQQVLQVATGTMVLSGLNLALSALGFAMLSRRLSDLNTRLAEVQRDVKAIRELLERKSRAQLLAAFSGLEKVWLTGDPANRRELLTHTHHALEPLLHEYAELLDGAEELEPALVAEEHYLLIGLAQVRCSAELGEYDLARHEFVGVSVRWQTQARRIARDLLLGERPERLLYREAASCLPAAALAASLDFTHNTTLGLEWIDRLRGKMPDFHRDKGTKMKLPGDRSAKRRHERELVAPALLKFTARCGLLEGYRAQLELMEQHQLPPSELERRVALVAPQAVDDYLILEPAANQGVEVLERLLDEVPPAERRSLFERLFGRGAP